MAQLQRPQADLFNRALELAGVDIFADPEGILDHEEEAGDDVLHQSLGAKGNGQAQYAESGEERRDVEAELAHHEEDSEADHGADSEASQDRKH